MERAEVQKGKRESPVSQESLAEPADQTKDELDRLEKELESTRDQLLRTLADFENYRRRIERETEVIGQAGKRDLILGLLEVMDSFDQADGFSSVEPASHQGLGAIHRQLLNLLEAHDVQPFDSLFATFDPELHEAVTTVSAERFDVQSGTIVQEYQKGYRWGDKVLRPARVEVAQDQD